MIYPGVGRDKFRVGTIDEEEEQEYSDMHTKIGENAEDIPARRRVGILAI